MEKTNELIELLDYAMDTAIHSGTLSPETIIDNWNSINSAQDEASSVEDNEAKKKDCDCPVVSSITNGSDGARCTKCGGKIY